MIRTFVFAVSLAVCAVIQSNQTNALTALGLVPNVLGARESATLLRTSRRIIDSESERTKIGSLTEPLLPPEQKRLDDVTDFLYRIVAHGAPLSDATLQDTFKRLSDRQALVKLIKPTINEARLADLFSEPNFLIKNGSLPRLILGVLECDRGIREAFKDHLTELQSVLGEAILELFERRFQRAFSEKEVQGSTLNTTLQKNILTFLKQLVERYINGKLSGPVDELTGLPEAITSHDIRPYKILLKKLLTMLTMQASQGLFPKTALMPIVRNICERLMLRAPPMLLRMSHGGGYFPDDNEPVRAQIKTLKENLNALSLLLIFDRETLRMFFMNISESNFPLNNTMSMDGVTFDRHLTSSSLDIIEDQGHVEFKTNSLLLAIVGWNLTQTEEKEVDSSSNGCPLIQSELKRTRKLLRGDAIELLRKAGYTSEDENVQKLFRFLDERNRLINGSVATGMLFATLRL